MFSRLETAGTAALWRSNCGVDQPPDRLRPIVSLHGVDRRKARYGKCAAYGLATLRAALLPLADTGVEVLVTNSLPQFHSRSAPDHPRADRITPRIPGHSTPFRIRGIHGEPGLPVPKAITATNNEPHVIHTTALGEGTILQSRRGNELKHLARLHPASPFSTPGNHSS